MMPRLRIAVFASHGGSNLQSLIDACESGQIDGEIAVVISNNRNAYALERARSHSIDALRISAKQFESKQEFQQALCKELEEREVDLICLSGYMKLLPASVIRQVKGRVLNIHPALLPKYGGKGMFGIHVHEAVIAAGDKETGVTIHQGDEKYDHGRIIAQEKVTILPDDTPEILQQRVLKVEHTLYPRVLADIAAGEIKLE